MTVALYPKFVARCGALQRGRMAAVAVLLGACGALALPPYGVALALVAPFGGGLLLLAGRRGVRGAFGLGWLIGLGYHTAGLWWIANALMLDVATYGWMIPFAVLGLPALLGLFWGAAFAVAQRWGGESWRRPALLIAALLAAEWLRGHIFTGFPWNLPGYAVWELTPLLQAAAWVGVYGLSLMMIAAAMAPALLLSHGRVVGARRFALAALAVPLVATAAGQARLAGAPPIDATAPGASPVRIVQPNIQQTLKWRNDERIRTFRKLIAFTELPAARPLGAVIWPETATPFPLGSVAEARSDAAAALARVAPDGVLIAGTLRVDRDASGALSAYWNSMLALDATGAARAIYDKHHLVPFGEYAPLRELPAVAHAAAGLTADFSVGPGPRTLRAPGIPPFSPSICYEIIFPGAVADPNDRPELLINFTNDAWYGDSPGPHQHFAQSGMRAVEEGAPLIRSANTGVSGLVDAYGRVVARMELGAEGVLDVVPPPAAPVTLYSRWGDAPALLLAAALATAALTRRRTAARSPAQNL